LDALLVEAVGLRWHDADVSATGAPRAPGFRVPDPPSVAAVTAFTRSRGRYATGAAVDAPDEARTQAEMLDERLRSHAERGGYLVLTVRPSMQERAARELVALGGTEVDVDDLV